MGILRISLLGSVRIVHDDRRSEVKITPKAKDLLAYLLLHGVRLHARERLMGVFWGDHPQERARSCLSTTLWRLRRALEPEGVPQGTYLVTRPKGYVGFNWESEHWLDVAAFEGQIAPVLTQPIQVVSAVEIQSLESTLHLYTGDLLESYYHDWALREQERLRCLYLDCLEHLMRYYQHHGFHEQSLAYGQQILEHDPLHEEIHREMMRIYLANGQRAMAVRQYDRLCSIMAEEEKDFTPLEETQALYAQALEGDDQCQEQATMPVRRSGLQQAAKQICLIARHLDEVRQRHELIHEQLEQTQLQLRQALQLIERLMEP